MRIVQTRNYQEMSQTAALFLLPDLLEKPDLVLGLATGSTPAGLYRALVDTQQQLKLKLEAIQVFHLDEYIGYDVHHPESMSSYLQAHLLEPWGLSEQQVHYVPALDSDVAQCELYEKRIAAAGGIDVQILGVGRNGHLAFNEPGTPFHLGMHIARLSASTRQANARYFDSGETPAEAMTLGLKNILSARRLLILASGEEKAEAVARMLSGPLSEDCPASILRFHPHVTLVLDQAAASKTQFPLPEFVPEPLSVFGPETPLPGQRVLVAAPHPDDASIGCGGTLARLKAQGAEIKMVSMSTGHRAVIPDTTAEERKALRHHEAESEAQIFQADYASLALPFYEHSYIPGAEDIALFLKELQTFQPDLVLSTSPDDRHPAHSFSAHIVQEALRQYARAGQQVKLWFYEGPWFLFERDILNTVCAYGISEHHMKMQGVVAHHSQIVRKRYDLAAAALASFRAITVPESRLSAFGGGCDDLGEHIEVFQAMRLRSGGDE